jgi:iron complex outermembrane receptor protein
MTVVLLIAWLTTSVFAQTATLRGKVTDKESGEVLPGANVVVTSANVQTGAATVVSGEFEVRNLPPGTYTVTVSFIGYEKKTMTEVVLAAGETTTLDVSLTPTGIQVNPISVTASRRPEKVLEAPADVNILEASQIEARPVLTAAEHLKSIPAVDVVTSGLNTANVVVRGFNNIFSGSLLSLVDNRIARVPSLRVNAYQLVPMTNSDIERIEVVLGPGSALYGPNSASGVFHILTKSPFGSEGTTVNVGGGERSVFMGSFRHAGSYNNKVGYKFSFQYYQGNDFKTTDPAEPATIVKFLPTAQGPIPQGGPVSNERDFDVERLSFEGRLDFKLSDEATAVFTGGFNQASNIELTGLGAAQVIDWKYGFTQARFNYKNLFVQGFVNFSNAGDTFIRRTGQLIVDKSKLFVGQIQHGVELGENQRFTYGFDALLTRPNTEGTINGRNENVDNIDEFGVYVQSETDISEKLKFVAAARIDDHSELEDPVFSPRAAFVFKPKPNQNFRITFNRAFSTPTTNNLFLDILSASNLGGLPFAIRTNGVPETGWTFRRNPAGGPFGGLLMRSPFTPAGLGGPAQFLPIDATLFWPAIVQILAAQGVDISALPAPTADQVGTVLRVFDTTRLTFGDPITEAFISDIGRIKEQVTNTLEVGYKGLIGEKLLAAVDVYYSKIKDFIGPLRVESPNAFFDPASLAAYLSNPLFGLPPQQVAALAEAIARIPVGTVTPAEAPDPTAILLTYRNIGDVDLGGLDLSFTYFANQNWSFSGNYSFVSKDFFSNVDRGVNIALNAPKHKFGASLQYRNPEAGFDGQLRLRFVDSFPVETGVFIGEVKSYAVLDLNANYKLPFGTNTRVNLTIQNLTDNDHFEIVGAPKIGRLILVQLSQTL